MEATKGKDDRGGVACLYCAFKHLAAAQVLWHELRNGYGDPRQEVSVLHISRAVGHLSQAEEHLGYGRQGCAELPGMIRSVRGQVMARFAGVELPAPEAIDYLVARVGALIAEDPEQHMDELAKLERQTREGVQESKQQEENRGKARGKGKDGSKSNGRAAVRHKR